MQNQWSPTRRFCGCLTDMALSVPKFIGRHWWKIFATVLALGLALMGTQVNAQSAQIAIQGRQLEEQGAVLRELQIRQDAVNVALSGNTVRWTDNDTYSTNAFVGRNGGVYHSLVDGNRGHDPATATIHWSLDVPCDRECIRTASATPEPPPACRFQDAWGRCAKR
jgi:hypothetical protein